MHWQLGEKRKLSQLDGADGDDDDGSESDASRRRQDIRAAQARAEPSDAPSSDDERERERSRLNRALTTPSSEVAALLAPVWGLPVSAFPTQLSSQYVQFRYRAKQRDFLGRVTAAVLTLTRVLAPRDAVRPGHVLWLYDTNVFAATERKGVVVEIVRVESDALVVNLPDSTTCTVDRAHVQRFYERIVRSGTLKITSS